MFACLAAGFVVVDGFYCCFEYQFGVCLLLLLLFCCCGFALACVDCLLAILHLSLGFVGFVCLGLGFVCFCGFGVGLFPRVCASCNATWDGFCVCFVF